MDQIHQKKLAPSSQTRRQKSSSHDVQHILAGVVHSAAPAIDDNSWLQTFYTALRLRNSDLLEGRKDVGDRQLFGILGRGKTQIAYAKVSINIVNILTSEVVFSSQGAGEYSLSEREVIGFGGTAGYDSTLNGKVLDLAIRDAVNNLVVGIDSGAWRPAS